MTPRIFLAGCRHHKVFRPVPPASTQPKFLSSPFSTSCACLFASPDPPNDTNNREPEEKLRPRADLTENKGSRLKTVLAGMKVEGFRKPVASTPPAASVRANVQPRERVKEDSGSVDEELHAPSVDPTLTAATERFAEAFATKIDPTTIKSELLAKLTEHAGQAEATRTQRANLSHLIAGMKIDRSKPRSDPGAVALPQHLERSFEEMERPIRSMLEPLMEDEKRRSQMDVAAQRQRHRKEQRSPERINLFGEPPLGIFRNLGNVQGKPKVVLKTWEMLEQQSLDKTMKHPPKNAFEEMIMWTKQGKLWNFPINNEQGIEHEENVDFSEHIFLDHLISDFPKKGPVKQFMDVVIYALSKNAFLTVKEKEEHVDWFRNYFKEKQSILVDVMGEELSAFTDRKL